MSAVINGLLTGASEGYEPKSSGLKRYHPEELKEIADRLLQRA